MSLKLVSLNIEQSKHLELVEPFLSAQEADIVCLQELIAADGERLQKASGLAYHAFEPMVMIPAESDTPMGLGIFSRAPFVSTSAHYYAGAQGVLKDSVQEDSSTYNNLNRFAFMADVEKEGHLFRIATTHFRWTPDGKPDGAQREDIKNLLQVLEGLGEFVLAGDFNAPRGGEIFGMLAARYKDNIPPHYKTSLDISLHRAGKTKPEELEDKMVDGLFSTSGYSVSDVELVPGVSDHCAIVANISPSQN